MMKKNVFVIVSLTLALSVMAAVSVVLAEEKDGALQVVCSAPLIPVYLPLCFFLLCSSASRAGAS